MFTGALLMMTAAAPLPTQDWVDLARDAGRWDEIAGLDPGYRDFMVGDPSHKDLWILARGAEAST